MWQRLTCTVPGAAALDLATVRAHLRLDDTSQDPVLTALMGAAQRMVEGPGGCGLALKPSTWVLSLDAFADQIDLELGPVASVTGITYVDIAGATQTLAGTEYLVDLTSRPARIVTAFGKSWPAIREQPGAVRITFTAGAATVPEDLVLAMTLMVAHWFENREAVTEAGLAPLPLGVEALLGPHRRHAI
jgi:uncharacterized phiE125 gp8 family phage protein